MVVILLALIFIFQPISWTTVPKNGVLSVIIDRTDTTTADAVKKLRLSGVQTPEAILYPVVSAASAFSSSGLKKGCYQLSPKSPLISLFFKLASGRVSYLVIRIPDGANIWGVEKLFKESPDLDRKLTDFSDATLKSDPEVFRGFDQDIDSVRKKFRESASVSYYEGLAAPDTYYYKPGQSDAALLAKMVRHQKQILDSEWQNRDTAATALIRTPYEALILASLIDKEAGQGQENYLVSSVFYYRLKIGLPLQTDPTVLYAKGLETRSDPKNITKDDLLKDNIYNTYRQRGLPPTPIACPSREAIHAAMHPADTKYLYFVASGSGRSKFSETLGEHNAAVNQYILKK